VNAAGSARAIGSIPNSFAKAIMNGINIIVLIVFEVKTRCEYIMTAITTV
jgi:hypothetical protein